MPVYQLMAEMPYDELINWFAYLERRPENWRIDDGMAKILAAMGSKAKPYELFASLSAIYKPPKDLKEGMIDTSNLMQSTMFQKIVGAKGGDTLDIWN